MEVDKASGLKASQKMRDQEKSTMSTPGTWGQGEPSSDSWPESHSLAEEGAEISCPNTAGSALREHRRSDAHIPA